MKKKIFITIILVLLASMLGTIWITKKNALFSKEKMCELEFKITWKSEQWVRMDLYRGKWKVTGIMGISDKTRTDYFPYHYLGRTVVIGSDYIATSIWYWPFELEWRTQKYNYGEIVSLNYDDEWVKSNTAWDVYYDIFGEKNLSFLRFYSAEDNRYINYAVILDEEHLLYSWMGGQYILEPYSYCDINLSIEDIIGKWNITFLDSYENNYEGGWTDIEEVLPAFEDELRKLKGTDFYAEDWLETKVEISKEELMLNYQTLPIMEFKEEFVSREDFEKEWEIHDGLSIYNDIIKVIYIKDQNGVIIPVVPIATNKIIIHIEEGWFMAVKE
ncbi:MAG: hypothetical protein UFG06_13505 [Lachnospiraceae bacterium]|nr:hypothetical protein [Lachnospiraceae bacterium]